MKLALGLSLVPKATVRSQHCLLGENSCFGCLYRDDDKDDEEEEEEEEEEDDDDYDDDDDDDDDDGGGGDDDDDDDDDDDPMECTCITTITKTVSEDRL